MAQLQSTNIYGTLKIHALTESTSKTIGALVVSGGVGIGKNLYVGGSLNITGSITSIGTITAGALSTSGALTANTFNGLTITNSTGTITVPNATTMTFPNVSGTVLTHNTSQSITGNKTFDSGTLKIKGSGSGVANIINVNSSSTSYNITLPDANDTLVGRATTDTLTNKTLTSPKMSSGTSINDSSGNELIKFPIAVSSAVNEIIVSNAISSGKPSIKAFGGDTNISLELGGKGTGKIYASSDIELNKSSDKNISVELNSGASGKTLTVSSGGTSAGTNLAGGNLILQSGQSTGNGISKIVFSTPSSGASGTGINAPISRVEIDHNGISSGTWNATKIATIKGGTGLDSYATGDIIYSSDVNTLSKLAIGASGKILRSTGTIPSWTTITIPDEVATGSVLATNTANALTAISSTSGLKSLQNSNGTISWNSTTGTGATVYSTSPSISTSITTGSTSFNLLNTQATTVNAFGATTSLNIASSATVASTYNLFNGATSSGKKTINIGTGGVAGSTTDIILGSVVTKDANSTVINSNVSITGNTTVEGDLEVVGDITIKGDNTVIETSTLSVEDINIEIGKGTTTDADASGGGITLHGLTPKTITWDLNGGNSHWAFNDSVNVFETGEFRIANASVLDSNTLGDGIVNSSLTTLGNVKTLTVVPNSENTDSDRIVISPSAVGLDSRSITIKTPTTALTANRIYTLPDVGANADFVMTEGNQTIEGVKTFNDGIVSNISGDINEVNISTPLGTSASIVVADGKTLTSNSSISLNGTDGKSITTYSSLVVGDTTNYGDITIKSNNTGARTLILNGNTTLVEGTMVPNSITVAGKALNSDINLNSLSAGAGLTWSTGSTYDGSANSTLAIDTSPAGTPSIYNTLTTGSLTIASGLTSGSVNIANGSTALTTNSEAVNILSGKQTGSFTRTLNLGSNGSTGTTTNINIGTGITSTSVDNKVSIGTLNKSSIEIKAKSVSIETQEGLNIASGLFKIDNVEVIANGATLDINKSFTVNTGSVELIGNSDNTSSLTLPSGNITIGGLEASSILVTNSSGAISYLEGGETRKGSYLRLSEDTGVPTWEADPFINIRTANETTALAGQTVFSFTGGYVADTLLDVYLNGLLLSPNDYDAIESPNIVLKEPAKLGDLVRIVGYNNGTKISIPVAMGSAELITVLADDTNTERYPLFVSNSSGDLIPYSDIGFTYNPYLGTLSSERFNSKATTGAPFTVASTVKVANLNADKVDGYEASPTSSPSTLVVRDSLKGINVDAVTATTGHFYSTTPSTDVNTGAVKIEGGLGVKGNIYGAKVYGAVWNDIADFVEIDSDTEVEFGKAYFRNEDGKIQKTNKKVSSIGIASDTFGFGVGQDGNKKQMPIAVGGWVLAFTKSIYKSGTAMVASENGILKKASILDKILFPERIIAIFDRVEKEETWNGVEVKGRHWVKVK